MSQGQTIALVVVAIALFDVLVVAVLLPMIVRAQYGAIPNAHPPIDPAPDAVRRGFQSFSFGVLNLGLGVHVLADARHLHLRPARVPRLIGMRPASVPWEAITLRPPGVWSGRRSARIAGCEVKGPAWCMNLAEPPPVVGEHDEP